MSDKEPKRWECVDCGHINKKTRTKYAIIDGTRRTSHICYKCSGRIKESAEWLAWHERMRERTMPAMLALMNSRMVR
jgi:hypothetical protein